MKPRSYLKTLTALMLALITTVLCLLPLRTDATEPDIVWSAQQHTSGVTCVAYAPDGRYVASGGADRAVKLYDASDGRLRRDWMEHSDRVNAVAFSPDSTLVASAGADRRVILWHTRSNASWLTLQGHSESVNAVAFSPDGRVLASGSDDHTIRFCRVGETQVGLIITNASSRVAAIAYSPDGSVLVSGGDDGMIRFWAADTGAPTGTPINTSNAVTAVAFSPDGQFIASLGPHDATIRLWVVDSGKLERTFTGHAGVVTALGFTPDGHALASASADDTLRFWRVADGLCLLTYDSETRDVTALAFSSDGQFFTFGRDDRTVLVARNACLPPAITLQPQGLSVFAGTNVTLRVTASGLEPLTYQWRARGANLLGATNTILTLTNVQYWDEGDYTVVVSNPLNSMTSTAATLHVELFDYVWMKGGHHEEPSSMPVAFTVAGVAFSPDGTLVASAGTDQTIKVWRRSDGTLLHILHGHPGGVRCLAFSPDGALLASGGEDRTVRLWRVADGIPLRRFSEPTGYVQSLDFSADGSLLAAVGNEAAIRLWRVADGALLQTIFSDQGASQAVKFFPDASKLLVASQLCLDQYRLSDGTRVFRGVPANLPILAMDVSPDWSTLALAFQYDSRVGVYDLASGAMLYVVTNTYYGTHGTIAKDVAFSPDGATLATAAAHIQLWRVSDGAPVGTVVVSDEWDSPCAVAFSPDGGTLASGTANGEVALWAASDGGLVRLLGYAHSEYSPRTSSQDGTVLALASAYNRITVLRGGDGSLLRTIEATNHTFAGHFAFSPGGAVLAVSGSGNFLHNSPLDLWAVATGTLLHSIPVHGRCVAFAPNGQLLASDEFYIGESDGIALRQVATGSRLRMLPGQATGQGGLAFSPDGSLLACQSATNRNYLALFRVSDGALVRTFRPAYSDGALAFSPDGSLLAVGGFPCIEFWRVADGTLVRWVWGSLGEVSALAFSPDGSILASGTQGWYEGGVTNYDAAVQFWRVSDGALLRTVNQGVHWVQALAFSSGGDALIVGRADAVFRVRNPFAPPPPPRLSCPVLSPGGPFQFIVTGASGCNYRLQTSSNLLIWTEWTNVVGTNATMLFSDPVAPSHPQRFYRAVTP